jgi:hypothetical protein
MPINNFSVGRDVAVDITGPNGPVTLSIVTHFDSKPMTKKQESHGIDGVVRFQYIPGGWQGTIEIDRANSNADDLHYTLETLYYNGSNVPAGTITETITEPDGSVTQWRFERVMFVLDDAGAFKGDSKVTQKLAWCASFRKKVA